jgi:5-methylcytosine-specific restriction enzyme A
MAVTQGHENPDWTREETILALALYLAAGEKVPSKSDPGVLELSALLRILPYHTEAAKSETFRNPDGVTFKLHNLRSVSTGKGLQHTSKTDRDVWAELGSDPKRVDDLAAHIKKAITLGETSLSPERDEALEEFFEGRLLTELHKRRERHPGVRKALLKARKRNGPLSCDLCDQRPLSLLAELEDAMFEAHHLLPISSALERKTQMRDMSLVCANCHRLVHRLISLQGRWLNLAECRELLTAETTD